MTNANNNTRLLIIVSRRLFIAMFALLLTSLSTAGAFTTYGLSTQNEKFIGHSVPVLVIGIGAIGGFVGLQRRLKDLTEEDLELLSRSWIHTSLSPLVGGILALLLYILFLSGILKGSLFPEFEADSESVKNITAIALQHALGGHAGYAKLFFLAFVAGYSEHFVTDVIGRFEGEAVKNSTI
uniref:hypothetical protein n=1 Tax=Cupriavidus yeoncheonensis TaxID=1462994 RepID=UPI003F498248